MATLRSHVTSLLLRCVGGSSPTVRCDKDEKKCVAGAYQAQPEEAPLAGDTLRHRVQPGTDPARYNPTSAYVLKNKEKGNK